MRLYNINIIYIALAATLCSCQPKAPSTAPTPQTTDSAGANTAPTDTLQTRRQRDEAAAQRFIEEARKLYAGGQYADAEARLDSLRRQHPHAINARKVALLLQDSIKIKEAANHDDRALREKFYEQKLRNDIQRTKKAQQPQP